MEYVYGALLLHKLGHAVDEHNLKKVITSTGSNVDEAKIKVLVASLQGVDINKELESATLAVASHASAPTEAKKEEKKEEEKPSEAAEGLSALFG